MVRMFKKQNPNRCRGLHCFLTASLLGCAANWMPFARSAAADLAGQEALLEKSEQAAQLSPQAKRVQVHKSRFQRALAAYQAQRYTQALQELQLLLKVEPNSFDSNELCGLVYAATGRDEKAYPYLAKAVRLNPRASAPRTTLATSLVRLHRNTEAEPQFKKAVDLDPASYDTNHNLGEFYIQNGQLLQAIPYLANAQKINPSVYNNGYDLALAYLQTGNIDQARRQIEVMIKTNDTAELHALLGEAEEKAKNYLISAAQYQRAAQMDPSESNIFEWGAELLLHQTFEPAIEVFKSGIIRYPKSTRLEIGLGIAQYGMGNFEEGAKTFFQAADMDSSDPLPLIFLGRAYDNLPASQTEAVRFRLGRFIETDRSNASLRYYYALSLWKHRQEQPDAEVLAKIESLFKSSILLDPHSADPHLQLAIVYISQRKYADAINQCEQALAINPNIAAIHYRLGQALSRSGVNDRAKKEFAEFERLHAQEIAETGRQTAEIQQFVYIIRGSNTRGR